jgi:tRNA 2-selenouridine synthase SelU
MQHPRLRVDPNTTLIAVRALIECLALVVGAARPILSEDRRTTCRTATRFRARAALRKLTHRHVRGQVRPKCLAASLRGYDTTRHVC